MRGTYTATYLERLSLAFARRRGAAGLDLGAAFDLIVGTSTGAIIGCALAAGIPLERVIDLYRDHGPEIFPRRLPPGLGLELATDILMRPRALAQGAQALRTALSNHLGSETLAEVYARRKIALAIPSVELSQHRSWVFKTPHLAATTSHRDDNYTLADVCLASTAAPIFRALAAINHPDSTQPSGYNVFADGGLWANNPALVGLIEALQMSQPDQHIEIFCLGTCPRPAGEQIEKGDINRGLSEWRFGGMAASLSIDAQEFAFDNMARMLSRHLDRPCEVVRFPREQVPAALMPYLELDDTRPQAIIALANQARTDADLTNSRCANLNDHEGRLITSLFMQAPLSAPTGGAQ